ncbi:MAG: DUF116 domain-containing protein [Thermoplasmata archaeon]|nr:DUF116 domain-containing protein [Thermoplasmata archaeon]
MDDKAHISSPSGCSLDKEKNTEIISFINHQNLEKFKDIPPEDKVLFLPHCMQNSVDCKAEQGEFGYECRHCGKCDISIIKRTAEEAGYRVFIVRCGSMMYKILSRIEVSGVLGVACSLELAEGMQKVAAAGIPTQGVLLCKDGCKDTKVNVEELLDILQQRSTPEPKPAPFVIESSA